MSGVTLDAVIGSIRAENAATARSQQTEIGWSELGDCEALLGYKLDGTWETDEPDDWGAIRGTWLHEHVLPHMLAAGADVIGTEVSVVYGGVPGHVDVLERHRIDDVKTSRLANIAMWEADEQAVAAKWQQVQGYAAGAVDAGLVDPDGLTVALWLVPIDGRFTDWRLWERPFDRAVADAALDRFDGIRQRKAAGERLRQEKPYGWCKDWCPVFSLCRDTVPDLEMISDPEIAAAARIYGEQQAIESAAAKAKKQAAALLRGLRGVTADGWQVTMTSPSGTKDVLDEQRIAADYAANGLLVPTIPTPTSSPSLRVTRVKVTP